MSKAGDFLFTYAYCPLWDKRLQDLANMAQEEDWDKKSETRRNIILNNYIRYTATRLNDEGKILYGVDENGMRISCFNTGLLTRNHEDIVAYFVQNRNEGQQPFCFNAFKKISELSLNQFDRVPEIANYFTGGNNASDLVFDRSLSVIYDIDHIIKQGRDEKRFPEKYLAMDDYELHVILGGALQLAIKRAVRNYRIAVPQYYDGSDKIQLLLPICFSNPKEPDLALVLEKSLGKYTAKTCLQLDAAYMNARRIAKLEGSWL